MVTIDPQHTAPPTSPPVAAEPLTVSAPVTGPVGMPSTLGWSKAYARRLMITDLLVLVWVVFGVQIAWLGLDSNLSTNVNDLRIGYTGVSLVVIVAWMAALGYFGTRGDRVVGVGSTEYRLVAGASVRVFGLLAIAAFLFHVELARGYVLIAFPVGMLVLLLSRWMWRQWLIMQRKHGEYSARVLLVGSSASVVHIGKQLAAQPAAGYRVLGAVVSDGHIGPLDGSDVQSFGGFDDVHAVLARTGADTVVITSADDLPPQRVRELSWGLEPGHQHLVVAPSLTDIGGPRIHTRPVQGLPLIHVETPTYEGRKLYLKRAFDLAGSSVLIALLSPVLLALALLVKSDSRGPVLFLQERVGINGKRFHMIKFRSMVVDAEARLQELSELDRAEGNTVLFKMKNDPRVTRVGGVMRRFSLDELPQLFNVWLGSMSLVGPRPPLQREVENYDAHVHRRFLVKPGITGLWQVSGRSDLSWEDSVRLDLYYVENWSIMSDVQILWRTLRAVVGSDGAY
jgi:exopolysaccharide biosynthesis polyprenyl glycosylphosphotransferase